MEMKEELAVLHQSEKSLVTLMLDTETGKRSVQKVLRGQHPVYEQLSVLTHPYLPKLYSVTQTEAEMILEEEYIEGVSLGQTVLSERQLRTLLIELCEVLTFLHSHGILHRDIKPSNLLLAPDGHLRLIDFDAAREQKIESTESDTRLLGTRGFAPPEQYGFAQTDARADIYAVGVTFRTLLGPIAGKPRWKKLLRKCTALDPKNRYGSAAQVKRALFWGRFRRWVLRPTCILLLLWAVCLGAMTAFVYTNNMQVQETLAGVRFFYRDQVFSAVDMDEMKRSDVELTKFTGDITPYYEALQQRMPEQHLIFSGYTDEYGQPLFGAFSGEYHVETGKIQYGSFDGLYATSRIGGYQAISLEECSEYAPAVAALYRMRVFDTPFL